MVKERTHVYSKPAMTLYTVHVYDTTPIACRTQEYKQISRRQRDAQMSEQPILDLHYLPFCVHATYGGH